MTNEQLIVLIANYKRQLDAAVSAIKCHIEGDSYEAYMEELLRRITPLSEAMEKDIVELQGLITI